MNNNEEPVVPVKKARKIKKEILIREKKVKGEAHINHKGRVIEAKKVGPDCKCKMSRKAEINHSDTESGDDELQPKFLHTVAFSYIVRVKTEPSSKYVGVKICRDAFLSLHGITRARLRRIQNSLAHTNGSPLDKRGQHQNRPNKTPPELDFLIQLHIKSFPARQSHYYIRKNPQRFYLHETLTVKEMYRSFLEKYRIRVSYKVYWLVFTTQFNIRFGLPRTDPCMMCDMLRQKIEANKNEQKGKKLAAEKELHLRKAEAFYSLKRKWKQEARTNKATVISFDFMQNLPLPHIRTNTVFYARQLWYFVFGVHDLSDDCASIKRKEKVTVETPQVWDDIMVTCRSKPSSFDVINVDQSNSFDVKKAVKPYFLKTPKPPLKLKTLRMYKISIEDPNIALIRESYSGPWGRCWIRNKTQIPTEFALTPSYAGPININPLKIKSLIHLCPTLSKVENRAF
ncbi:hypothetical protein NQ314_004555 [Rhamnusium bicolor]|uniref:Uncharacterized protein n=1 Tax=Rhamnusium bicolor TaxID=1586634 RepID=A0AAV8ZIR2_9CUCU|nr:hypothetical protein NQ314_004555 [Rhamnusium bicolor]